MNQVTIRNFIDFILVAGLVTGCSTNSGKGSRSLDLISAGRPKYRADSRWVRKGL